MMEDEVVERRSCVLVAGEFDMGGSQRSRSRVGRGLDAELTRLETTVTLAFLSLNPTGTTV